MIRILIVDKQRSIRNILRERLEFEGYTVETAESLTEANALYDKRGSDLVIVENVLMYEYLDNGGRLTGKTPIIVISDDPQIREAVFAMRNGAYDYLGKPLDMNLLFASIKEACGEKKEEEKPKRTVSASVVFKKPKAKSKSGVPEIVGESDEIMFVKKLIEKVAPSEARVLVTGANGTGKELVAKWLHEKSLRAGGPFVEVNCAAIPSELIESELFGHEKGAFTSAIKQRKGKFEQADGGTLFLDEIGDMSLSAQAKVLRALQENKISRVGSDVDISVNVRVVSATNKNLREEIQKGNFREDLYHRLSVIVIRVPSLIDRIDDIPLLIGHFMDKICEEYGIPTKSVKADAVKELQTFAWTGNIRELRNVMERLIILSGDEITMDDVRAYTSSVIRQ